MLARPRSRAFSLLEVILAVGLVGGAMIAVLQARDGSLRRSAIASEKLVAAGVANDKLAGLAAQGFPRSYQTGGTIDAYGELEWRIAETYKSHSLVGHVREIEVTVHRAGGNIPAARLAVIIPVES